MYLYSKIQKDTTNTTSVLPKMKEVTPSLGLHERSIHLSAQYAASVLNIVHEAMSSMCGQLHTIYHDVQVIHRYLRECYGPNFFFFFFMFQLAT